ncbi:MAG: DUF2189 domain-containing protein [Hyphomicrobiaceae bacterium]|nr:DUF2189 domain-containing protein [Hyphomicrobiaceae bacterium]
MRSGFDQDDLTAAIRAGVADFAAYPIYGLAFAAVYVLGGLLISWFVLDTGRIVLAFPLAAGFALIGPFIALGLYEVSRRREEGLQVTSEAVFGVIFKAENRSIVMMGIVLGFILLVWVRIALLVYALFFGSVDGSFDAILTNITVDPRGIAFLIVGNAIGAVIAFTVFAITVVAVPMLLDRHVTSVEAMTTSVRTVLTYPQTMFSWAVFVAFLLVLACVPAFLGLLWVLPVLGHTTWHLYRRLVPRETAAAA